MRHKQVPIALLILLAILTACGRPATGTTSTSSTSVAAEATAAPTVAVPTEAPTAAVAPTVTSEAPTTEATAAATTAATSAADVTSETATDTAVAEQGATKCSAGMRLFRHDMLASGPVCIPEHPQRVVALDIAALETLLLKNQPPVGTATWILEEMPLLVPQYAQTLSKIQGLGYPAELEKVTLLKPDLILAPNDTIDIKLASRIAPVITPKSAIYNDWKLGMEFWSDVLNVKQMYTEMEANYRTRVAELKAALGQPEKLKISVISASSYGVSLWMPDTPPGAILADVCLARPEAQSLTGKDAVARYSKEQYIEISEEQLNLADGDAIFYFTYAATDPSVADKESAFIKTFQAKPIWNTLSAVKAGKAYFVPGYWWRSQTYLLANLVLDDLFAKLTTTKATTPVLSFQQ